MFYLIGAEGCVRNYLLASGAESSNSPDLSAIRSEYIEFCRSIGGELSVPRSGEEQYTLDESRIDFLSRKFTEYSQLTDLPTETEETPLPARIAARKPIEEAKAHLKELNPQHAIVSDLFIHTFFYKRSREAGGGSVSSAPGVIWCAIRKSWTVDDVTELIVHELAHNLLFVDERTHVHYTDFTQIAKPENFAHSTILQIQRPLDKVFHSLLVAYDVLNHRLLAGEPLRGAVHPSSSVIVAAVEETISSIRKLVRQRSLVTDRFHEILDSVEKGFLQGKSDFLQTRKLAS